MKCPKCHFENPETHQLHRDIDLESLWDYPPFKEILRPKG